MGPWQGELPSLPLSLLSEDSRTEAHNYLHGRETSWVGSQPALPRQLYPKSGASPNWAGWSWANCCHSVLITAGRPLGVRPPLSAGWLTGKAAERHPSLPGCLPEGVGGAKLPRKAPSFPHPTALGAGENQTAQRGQLKE